MLEGIPTGTTCTVTEDANGDFTQTSVIPANGTVVIGGTGPQTVAFVNTREVGSLTISKTANAPGTFTFDVDCTDNEFDRVVIIEGGGSQTITRIPTTTRCTVTERNNPLFTSSVLPIGGTVSIDAGGENVAFVNTAKPNGLTIDKKVNGGDHATTGEALPPTPVTP